MPRVADGARHIRAVCLLSAQRLEARAKLLREELRLFPGGEVPALGQPVVVDSFGKAFSVQLRGAV